mmetsp:Transcript_72259/g.211745  ORF Transcript_72259/g.211745 Transcript_72259/m.211745 type:complete len:89 (-) Transcript_72259:417-683(-)
MGQAELEDRLPRLASFVAEVLPETPGIRFLMHCLRCQLELASVKAACLCQQCQPLAFQGQLAHNFGDWINWMQDQTSVCLNCVRHQLL